MRNACTKQLRAWRLKRGLFIRTLVMMAGIHVVSWVLLEVEKYAICRLRKLVQVLEDGGCDLIDQPQAKMMR
jgi:hypothetical protein